MIEYVAHSMFVATLSEGSFAKPLTVLGYELIATILAA